MLKNEKYIGDCLNQKTYMTEELPRRCLRNRGEYAQYYVEDAHPAIIDREAFVAVQALLQMRARGHVQHGEHRFSNIRYVETCERNIRKF
jgi:hypothetical protein